MRRGVIVGSNKTQEHYLPWWWINYRLHNCFPVTFMDFGMSEAAKKWCQQRGAVIEIKESLFPQECKKMFWQATPEIRRAFFKKPLACLQSPYEETIWLDNDCLVRHNLTSLFSFCNNPAGFGIAKEPEEVSIEWRAKGLIAKECSLYNSGVFVFRSTSFFLQKWVEACKNAEDMHGDEVALSNAISFSSIKPALFSFEYNWLLHALESHIDAATKIVHFAGTHLKELIEVSLKVLNKEPLGFFHLPKSSTKRIAVVLCVTKEEEEELPWWKIQYLKYNTQPVYFWNISMSEKARTWCSLCADVIEKKDLTEVLQFLQDKVTSVIFLRPPIGIKGSLDTLLSEIPEDADVCGSLKKEQMLSRPLLIKDIKKFLLAMQKGGSFAENLICKNIPEFLWFNYSFDEKSRKENREKSDFLHRGLYMNVSLY